MDNMEELLKSILTGMDQMRQEMGVMHQEMNDMRQEMNGMRQEINDMHQEMNDMHQEISDMHQEMNDMHQEINDMHQEINDMRQEMNDKIEAVDRKVDDLAEQVKENTGYVQALVHRTDILSAKFDGIDLRLAEVEGKTEKNTRDITTLDRVTQKNWGEILDLKESKIC